MPFTSKRCSSSALRVSLQRLPESESRPSFAHFRVRRQEIDCRR